MSERERPYLVFPRWRNSANLFAVLLGAEAAIAGLYSFFVQPIWQQDSIPGRLIFGVLVVGTLTLVHAPYLLTVVRRARAYASLWSELRATSIESEASAVRDVLLRRLVAERAGMHALTIAGISRAGSALCLRLVRTQELTLGSEVLCVQLSTSSLVGHFNVSTMDVESCIASEVVIHDALWWGAVHDRASRGDLEPPDDTVALLIRPGGAG